MNKFFQSLLSSQKGSLSSKRLCGVTGWGAIIGILSYCSATGKHNPDGLGDFMIACSTLLGVDSVTDIWKNKQDNQ